MALFCSSLVKFQLDRRNARRTKQYTGKLPLFGKKRRIARDPASSHPLRGAGGLPGVFAASRLSRSREPASTVSPQFTERDRSRGDLHSIFALGVGRSAAVRADEFAACRRGFARVARGGALSRRRHHSQPVQALRPEAAPPFFLRLMVLATRAASGMFAGLQSGFGFDGV